MTEPEPCEVLLAWYEYEDYSGSARVVYRRGDDYYEVTGGHCSCYGLEDQWEPEKYDRSTLIQALMLRIQSHPEPYDLFVLEQLNAQAV